MSLTFAKTSRRTAARYTAVTGERRYLVEYRPRLAAWTATVSDPRGTSELGRGKTLAEAQQLAQSHAGGLK